MAVHIGRKIEQYLKATKTPATRFGRESVRDPRLVYDIRNGREVGPRLAKRILAFIEARSA
jgi:2,4-dienoyl-CoA reductase-like NADH-dependent reductase (Old Yellow Enzyme family)